MQVAVEDLSKVHHLVSSLFKWPATKEEWDSYRLTQDQIDSFKTNGFLAGVKMLDEQQIQTLGSELSEIVDPHHPGNELFYEFHSNESADANTILFHALGAWRVMPGFHDVLWNPRFVMAASQLLGDVPVRF